MGQPDHPLSDARLTDKFADCAARARNPLSAQRARELAAALLVIDQAPSVQAVLGPLLE